MKIKVKQKIGSIFGRGEIEIEAEADSVKELEELIELGTRVKTKLT